MNNHQTKSKNDRQVALHYIKTLADTAREPFLVLSPKSEVIFANEYFLKTFQVTKKETEKKSLYDLGDGQWNILELKKLLGEILPNKKIVTDYEVDSSFPKIGRRIMLLNARQIDAIQLIILCFEDISIKKALERKSKKYTRSLEGEVAQQTTELKNRIKELEELTRVMVGRELKMSELKKEIIRIKKLKKMNHNHNNENSKQG